MPPSPQSPAAAAAAASPAHLRHIRETEGIRPPRSPRSPGRATVRDPVLDAESVEEARHYEWLYHDDSGVVQGPYPASVILRWVRQGLFPPTTPFRREDRSEPLPLREALPYLLRAEHAEILSRWRKPSSSSAAAAAEATGDETTAAPDTEVTVEGTGPGLHVKVTAPPTLDLDNLRTVTLGARDAGVGGAGGFQPKPDLTLILLPPIESITPAIKTQLERRVNAPVFTVTKLDSDAAALQRSQRAFAKWLSANSQELSKTGLVFDHRYGETALIVPAHSIIVKSASHILCEAVEAAESCALEAELKLAQQTHGAAASVTRRKTAQDSALPVLLRTAHPEPLRLLLRKLHEPRLNLALFHPCLVACVYTEARRLAVHWVASEALNAIVSRGMDEMIALCECLEVLDDGWELFDEVLHDLTNCGFLVLAGRRYLRLGPLAFRRLLCSDNVGIGEIQLFVAAHLWLSYRAQGDALTSVDFWELLLRFKAKRKPDDDAVVTQARYLHRHAKRRGEGKGAGLSRGQHEHSADLMLSNSVYIFSGIRFDQLAPSELVECRTSMHLDALLVDGCLLKLLGQDHNMRLRPWTENAFFAVDCAGGRFPVRITRMAAKDGTWAWSTGDTRVVAVATWAFEVTKTRRGAFSLGAVLGETGGFLPGVDVHVPAYSRVVYYINLVSSEFYSAVVGSDYGRATYRLLVQPRQQPQRSPKDGDVIVLSVRVDGESLRLHARLFDDATGLVWCSWCDFPSKVPRTLFTPVTRRPLARLAPWLEMLDRDDSLAIPELRLDEDFYDI